jgi:hypothetical protein
VFENFRETLRDLASGRIPPAQKAAVLAHMRATLVKTRVGLADLDAAREKTLAVLTAERDELETVRRRRGQAEKIGDHETVEIAQRFEAKHAERVQVLTRKLTVQEDELRMAQAEVESMTAALRSATSGASALPEADQPPLQSADLLDDEAELKSDLDALVRQKARATREAEAEERLAELKRRMNK